jgi:hypothetical protein
VQEIVFQIEHWAWGITTCDKKLTPHKIVLERAFDLGELNIFENKVVGRECVF